MRWGEGRVWLRADFGLGLAECSRLRFDGSCAPALFPLELGLDLLHQCEQVVLLVDAELLVDVRGVGAGELGQLAREARSRLPGNPRRPDGYRSILTSATSSSREWTPAYL